MTKKHLNKLEAEFMVNFFSMIYKKEFSISFELFDKQVVSKGYQISINPYGSRNYIVDRHFEQEWSNVRTPLGLYKKVAKEALASDQSRFNFSIDFFKKIEKLVVIPTRNDQYWQENPENYLKFIDYACSKTKEVNYSFNYLELIWSLTNSSYIDFIDSVPGLEKKIKALLLKHNFLDNPFLGNYKKVSETNQQYIKINLDVLITNNLENYFRIDEERNPIFNDEKWRSYYLDTLLKILLDAESNLLKIYTKNVKFKSALDYLVKEYSEDIPQNIKSYFIENKIGEVIETDDTLFNNVSFKNEHLILINISKFKKAIPQILSNVIYFEQRFGQILSGVIDNVNNETETKILYSEDNIGVIVSTNTSYDEDYFKKIIKKCISEISIVSVEMSDHVIIDNISILVNDMIMRKESPINKGIVKKSLKM